ncbi:MAG: endonuclease MutS2, partial [Clostridia bacterium]|nr:endonuclease MutS2 [Clostridia bacterium]
MTDRVLTVLEYHKIIESLRAHARCCIGKELAAELKPESRLSEVERGLSLTAEAESYLFRTGMSPVDDFPDMRPCLKRIHAALALSTSELLGIMRCFRAVRLCRERLVRDGEEPTMLGNMAESFGTHRSVEEEISRCIISEEEIFDGASPQLARIRQSMRRANEKVRERLNTMIRSTSYQKYLQEPIVTIRNGRYVVPVRQEYRQQVPGLVHDQSGSGATLYIEPTSVVELGNEYKKLLSEESEEISRILAELTSLAEPYAKELEEDLSLLGEIDVIFAKASLAKGMRAVRPAINSEGHIRIVQGRHPLIDPAVVVPIDVWLGKDFRTLIITGPNTGGKTVTLKTVGLFTLMAQAGMFVPAAEGTQLSVFEEVFADIGDEQSIEQSLSTFSSHMKNVVNILNAADDRSLVLLDELGAGTDPIEGAALAMSILSELHSRSAVTMATTHYSEIKAFALTRDGMENASMEFDVDRLCPTYRLFIGIPGRSNAFEISKRLGISEHIIEGAKEFLNQEDVQFEDVISNAESQRRIAEEERRLASEARLQLDKLRRETEEERRRLAADKEKYRAKAREEARQLVTDAKREMEETITALRKLKAVDQKAVERAIQEARDKARKTESKLAEPMAKPEPVAGQPPKSVKAGDTVKVLSLGQKGTVLGPQDAKGDVAVQIGIMKMTVKLGDLRLMQDDAPKKGAAKVKLNTAAVPLELDIRGQLVDDAVLEVDRYLDTAAMAGRTEVNIIHGKGTGALRAGVQAFLKK